MQPSPRTHPSGTFLLRHSVGVLTALTVLFILQSGLVPFDFIACAGVGKPRVFFLTTTSHVTFPDLVSNIFLYVPLGALLHWGLAKPLCNRLLTFVATTAICGGISVGIEWLQAYSAVRVSSLVDVVSNTIGAGIGAAISFVALSLVPRIVGAALWEFHERPAAATVKAYCGLLVLFAALPFSFSLDSGRLKQSIKGSVFTPFANPTPDQAVLEAGPLAGDHRTYTLARWRELKRWSRWACEAASFLVLAWLMQALLRDGYRFTRRASAALVWWLGGLFSLALSLLQLTVFSRGMDVTDILFRWLGLGIGLWAYTRYGHRYEVSTSFRDNPGPRRAAQWGLTGSVAYIIYTGTLPWSFGSPDGGVTAAVRSPGFLPFLAYFAARFDVMLTDVMEKFAAYVVFAALLAASWRELARRPAGERFLRVTVVGVVLASVIEIVQVFIPVRVTSSTDVILAAAGCLVGVLAHEHGSAFYRFATSPAVTDAYNRPSRAPESGRRTLSDALIGTLMEPNTQAPVEHVPAVHERTDR